MEIHAYVCMVGVILLCSATLIPVQILPVPALTAAFKDQNYMSGDPVPNAHCNGVFFRPLVAVCY